jgi:type VII secretion effector (TIGR04197 family)
MATLQSLGSVAGLINLDYGKFKYAVDQMRTSADGINGNVEERARGAERSEALDEFAEQFVQLQRIISLYKSLIKKDIDAIETTGEQLKEIDLKLEGVWKGLQFNTLIFFYVISVACLDRFFELSCHGERHIVNLQF